VSDPAPEKQGENTWDRLRSRKVVQWGIAYSAGAWGLLQGIVFLRDTFGWPHAIQQAATILLLIGLPIVLTIAWYHGDRGQQGVTRIELAILTLLFLLGGGIFWRYEHTRVSPAPATGTSAASNITAEQGAPASIPVNDRSVAVLPFVNMSSDSEQDYFSDGLSEELLNLLSQVPQLRVIARTSSFSFKGKEVDIADIARRLSVANVLEGSVRKSGDTLRITAQLVRASDSSHLWSKTYDRKLTDVFKVQDEIAAAVVAELRIKLLGAAPTAKATDPKAYALFLQAREIGRRNTAEGFERSIAMYKQALALDPSYAAAWEGLAAIYCAQALNYQRPADESIRLAREATEKALALDPDHALAYARLGWIAMYYDRDLAAAARYLEHAMSLEPSNLEIISAAAGQALRLNRLDQAIAASEYVVARDPVNPVAHDSLAMSYLSAGRFEEAMAEFQAEVSLSPGSINAHAMIGEVLLHKNDAQAALAEVQKEADEGSRLVELSMANHALGRKAESDAALAEAISKYGNTMAYFIAFAYAYRGEADRAFEWLDTAFERHDPSLGSISNYPMFGRLQSDPRWLPFLRKVGVAPEQLEAIKFEVKLPK
jgi:TolB-like protein/Flp pilus assembly protein TadD